MKDIINILDVSALVLKIEAMNSNHMNSGNNLSGTLTVGS
jgi:hypothetical protein